jgi:hypothetical protein
MTLDSSKMATKAAITTSKLRNWWRESALTAIRGDLLIA